MVVFNCIVYFLILHTRQLLLPRMRNSYRLYTRARALSVKRFDFFFLIFQILVYVYLTEVCLSNILRLTEYGHK